MKYFSVPVREFAIKIFRKILYFYYTQYYGMSIHPTAKISISAHIDKTNPEGIVIGEYSCVTFGVAILTHDMCTQKRCKTIIGKNVFVGANSVIMPGLTISDNVVIGAGSIVTKDIPSNVIVAGNPAITIRDNVDSWYGIYGILKKNKSDKGFFER